MLHNLFDIWRAQSDLNKLQYAYGVVVIVTLVAAGLVGLLNQTTAWHILSVTWLAAVALCVNLVSFALVNLVVPAPKRGVHRSARPRK